MTARQVAITQTIDHECAALERMKLEAEVGQLRARIAELERHLENAGVYGNNGRYWEGRWRDENIAKAELVGRVAGLEDRAVAQAIWCNELSARAEKAEAELPQLRFENKWLREANKGLAEALEKARNLLPPEALI